MKQAINIGEVMIAEVNRQKEKEKVERLRKVNEKLIKDSEEDGLKYFEVEQVADEIIDKNTPKVIEPKEVIEEPNTLDIDNILQLKSRNASISYISDATGFSVDCIEQVISSQKERFDQKAALVNHVASIDTAILDLQGQRNNHIDYLKTIKTDSSSFVNPREPELNAINNSTKSIVELIKEKTKVIISVPKDIDNDEETRFTFGEQKLYDIIYNNPKINTKELVEKTGLSNSRVKQLLNGYKRNIGLIKKGYIKGIPENLKSGKGGAEIYYSTI